MNKKEFIFDNMQLLVNDVYNYEKELFEIENLHVSYNSDDDTFYFVICGGYYCANIYDDKVIFCIHTDDGWFNELKLTHDGAIHMINEIVTA